MSDLEPDAAFKSSSDLSKILLRSGSVLPGYVVCPVCHGALVRGSDSLDCTVCQRSYPIVDGLPVLIPQRAKGEENDGVKGNS